MGCYYILCHNTYAYSLLFYKVYIKRENAGRWDSGLEKEQILETYSEQLQKSWNFTDDVFQIYKKHWAQELHQGGHTLPMRAGAPPTSWAPGGPPVTIFCYMESFDGKIIISHLLRRNSAATRRNLGGTNLGLRRSCSVGETSLREGEIIAIVITNAPLIGRGQSPSTSSSAPSPLKTLVHLLYPILVSKSGIGASSVNYSL